MLVCLLSCFSVIDRGVWNPSVLSFSTTTCVRSPFWEAAPLGVSISDPQAVAWGTSHPGTVEPTLSGLSAMGAVGLNQAAGIRGGAMGVEGVPLDLLVNLGWRICCKPSRKAH